jgi:MFS family permease
MSTDYSQISPVQRKVVIAACFGTFLEWYDFLTFAALAGYFGTLFFPPDNPVAGLLESLATFGAGMLVRPLGSALFGSLADRYGRRPVFIATISLMGIATFGVGLLPTYAEAGLLASLLLLTLRLLQGFAAGGEIGGVAVYLTEHAPAGRRGFYTSVLQLMGPLGIMASTAQVVLLQAILGDDAFHAWGWRVPFLFSAVLLAVSLLARKNLAESPVYQHMNEAHATSRAPLFECFKDRRTLKHMALLFFCISAGGSILFFSSQVYAAVFLKSVIGINAGLASALVLTSTVALFPLTLWCGHLSDRIGRRPVMLAGLALGAASLLPVYGGLMHFCNPVSAFPLFFLLLVPALATALVTGPQTAVLAELFPARTRYTAAALPHNLAAGWIGGLSPFVITLIDVKTRSALAGLAYPTALLAIAFVIGYFFMPETRSANLED